MPVDDHPVHEKVKVGADHRYDACQSKVRASGYLAKDGFEIRLCADGGSIGVQRFKWVKDVLSKECRYDGGGGPRFHDDRCNGCPRQGSGKSYSIAKHASGS